MAISSGTTNLNLDTQKIELLEKLPPSARRVFKIVKEKGPITSAEIVEICNLAPRTVRHGLKLLVRAGLIEKLPHLLDMRSSKFYCE
ncbi:MAG: helix-turn-helix domain-containing protein [Candidatus Heimdallarchaeum aukensis]|uniref:Helix-turn-helix domain-containing protein n=1 Tax=Candidatus Heimdallarchaeum aukensis TaxID=2876573 RepID=A0A9Y1FIU7_9ARCH|nr:MAG: helix-turn-helix domain-containing protein [Candidatus Heimdallarchaeum aukensis]